MAAVRLINGKTMSLVFEQIHTPGTGQLSYLIGDDDTGAAAVIDPRADVDVYLNLAQRHRVAITHIFETHIHADFLSGARELASRQPSATIYLSAEGGAVYGFDAVKVRDGDRFELGALILKAQHTPGHTPEHLSFLACQQRQPHDPWGIFSGDCLLADSVGRPDLLGRERTESLVTQLHQTITGFYAHLDDGVLVFPGHGSGSYCGPDIGDRLLSTIGQERKRNPFFGAASLTSFRQHLLQAAPPEPSYYQPMKILNASGPPVFGGLPPVPSLPVAQFQEEIDNERNILLDTRDMLAFGGGHIPHALHIGGDSRLSAWSGWLIDFYTPLLLVLPDEAHLAETVRLLWRTGHTRFAGYLVGGMHAWNTAGLPLQHVPQISVHELHTIQEQVQILDVRSPAEWEAGRIPGALHCHLPEIRQRVREVLDVTQPVATYCGTGYRASIAASLLLQQGFQRVTNIPGSFRAWQQAQYPTAAAA